MFKKLICLLVCALVVMTSVYAQNTENGNSETDNSTTSGSETEIYTTTDAKNVTKSELAKEKRVIIKTQKQELAQLRTELKAKIAEKKEELKQYREKEKLSTEDRTQVKATIEAMKAVQIKIGDAYKNASKSMSEYKGDASENKLTGLDLVIESQKTRIQLFKEAIAELSA